MDDLVTYPAKLSLDARGMSLGIGGYRHGCLAIEQRTRIALQRSAFLAGVGGGEDPSGLACANRGSDGNNYRV